MPRMPAPSDLYAPHEPFNHGGTIFRNTIIIYHLKHPDLMRVTTNGVSIHYEVRGRNGPALIMLHGNGEDHGIFDRAVDYLEQVFTVYLPDTRGHGESSPVGEDHYQDMVDDLSEFIRKLGLEKPAVCGFSDGAIVGLMFASQNPGVLSHLIACGANTRPETLGGLRMALDRIGDPGKKDPKVRLMLTEPDISAEDLARIDVPVTVVAGSRDCVKRSDTEFIAGSVPGAVLVIMGRADHSSYIVHSTRIVDVVFKAMGVDTSAIAFVDRYRAGPIADP